MSTCVKYTIRNSSPIIPITISWRNCNGQPVTQTLRRGGAKTICALNNSVNSNFKQFAKITRVCTCTNAVIKNISGFNLPYEYVDCNGTNKVVRLQGGESTTVCMCSDCLLGGEPNSNFTVTLQQRCINQIPATPTPTVSPTKTPTPLPCSYGITDDSGSWYYIDCCGTYQSGISANTQVCFNPNFGNVGILPLYSACTVSCVTPTPTRTPTVTPTIATTVTPTSTSTPTSTPTPTPSITTSVTPTVSPTSTLTPTPSITTSVTPTVSPTGTPSVSETPTPTVTQTPTVSPTVTPSVSETPTPTVTETPTPTPTVTQTPTPSPIVSYEFTGFTTDVLSMSGACSGALVPPSYSNCSVLAGDGSCYLFSDPLLNSPLVAGYYVNSSQSEGYQVTGGLGQITSLQSNPCV